MSNYRNLGIIQQQLGSRTFSALWFGILSLILILPFSTQRYLSISQWSKEYAFLAVLLEGVIPFAMATFYGGLFGPAIIEHKDKSDFGIGIRVSIAAAFSSILLSILFIAVLNSYIDCSRFMGGIVIAMIFGFPFYGMLAGLGAMGLRAYTRR